MALACTIGHLEINAFEPLIATRILDTIGLLIRGRRLFAERCALGIEVNEFVAMDNLMGSSALATVLVPKLGFEEVARITDSANADGRRFTDTVIELGLMS